MKLPGYYSSGEFAAKAHITKKTIRYYDEHHILKPSFVNENGARFYTDEDFARLQQILFLKYLGFSLDDIREMTMRNGDRSFLSESLHMQLGLMEERLERAKWECEQAVHYDYIVVNDDLKHASAELRAIMLAEKCKTMERIHLIKEEL